MLPRGTVQAQKQKNKKSNLLLLDCCQLLTQNRRAKEQCRNFSRERGRVVRKKSCANNPLLRAPCAVNLMPLAQDPPSRGSSMVSACTICVQSEVVWPTGLGGRCQRMHVRGGDCAIQDGICHGVSFRIPAPPPPAHPTTPRSLRSPACRNDRYQIVRNLAEALLVPRVSEHGFAVYQVS